MPAAMKTRFLLLLCAAAAAAACGAPPGRAGSDGLTGAAEARVIRGSAGAPAAASAAGAAAATAAGEAALSAGDLTAFARIYTALAAARAQFQRDLGGARTAAAVRALRCRLNATQQEALARQGWTAERFGRVAATLDADPGLVQRAIAVLARGS